MTGPSVKPDDVLAREFATISELIHAHALLRPDHAALMHQRHTLSYSALDRWADRVASTLQREQVGPCGTVAICAATSLDYVAVFLGSLRAGVAVAPLPVSATSHVLAAMMADAGARILFLDRAAADTLSLDHTAAVPTVVIEDSGPRGLQSWMTAADSVPAAIDPKPHWPFNVIYRRPEVSPLGRNPRCLRGAETRRRYRCDAIDRLGECAAG